MYNPEHRKAFWDESGFPSPVVTISDLVNDAFEWGKDKMVGNETTSLQFAGKGHKSIDDILKMTEDFNDVRAEYDSGDDKDDKRTKEPDTDNQREKPTSGEEEEHEADDDDKENL